MSLALIGAFLALRSNGTFGTQPHVTALVDDAGGALREGSDVKLNGAVVGKVVSIERADSGEISLDLAMLPDALRHVPANVVARILPATVFGTTYVDLTVAGTADGTLRAGAVVPADTTQGTLELQQALDDIDRLTKAVGPAELASAIGSAAEALDGRGKQLRRTVWTLNDYLDRLNPRLPRVRDDLTALASTTRLVNGLAPDLLDATDDALGALNTIVAQQASLTALIAGGTNLARISRRFLVTNDADLVRFIDASALVVDAVYDNRRTAITDAIDANIEAFGNAIPSMVREGFWRGDATLSLSVPPYYTPEQRPTIRTDENGNVGMGALLARR